PATSELYSPTLHAALPIYYLNYEDKNQPALRKDIIDKWSQFGQIDQDALHISSLYFGDGGVYTADELNNRADMYDQLESQIYLLDRKSTRLNSSHVKISYA